MFRRKWSGLPEDVTFPSDLKGLGYFVNDQDEIRSIDSPMFYFKYFIDRHERINQRQRFYFNHAVADIVSDRLTGMGMKRVALPLGTSTSEKHVPIFLSKNIEAASRVVVVFGETTQDLGLLAHRVASGEGGISKGSMVPLVGSLQDQLASPEDASPPGIVIANMGQRYWWPEGRRTITVGASGALPLPSLVHYGRKFVPALNEVAGSESAENHLKSIFTQVLAPLVQKNCVKIDVIAIGETCEIVERFLDEKNNWKVWGKRLSSMVLLDTTLWSGLLERDALKDFLAKRARCYVLSDEEIDTPLSTPAGNAAVAIPATGLPCYSSSEGRYTERILVKALSSVTAYIQHNALNPHAENPSIEDVVPRAADDEQAEGEDGEAELRGEDEVWGSMDESAKPSISTVNPELMEREVKYVNRLEQFQRTGEAPDDQFQEEDGSDGFDNEDAVADDGYRPWG